MKRVHEKLYWGNSSFHPRTHIQPRKNYVAIKTAFVLATPNGQSGYLIYQGGMPKIKLDLYGYINIPKDKRDVAGFIKTASVYNQAVGILDMYNGEIPIQNLFNALNDSE